MKKLLRYRGLGLKTSLALALVLLVTITTSQLGHTQTFTLLYAFPGAERGATPLAGLARDANGNLYGTTGEGGGYGRGIVFELTTTGVESPLHQFKGLPSDGARPAANLLPGTKGNIYGTTSSGSADGSCTLGCGTVFELTLSAGHWTETVLYSFAGGEDGTDPSSLIEDAAGNLYGTTPLGGGAECIEECGGNCPVGTCGTVFELTLSAGHWAKTTLDSFTEFYAEGSQPQGGLIRDAAGNLYGTTLRGGPNNTSCPYAGGGGCGTVFELTPSGSDWTETVLYSFGGVNGETPGAGVVRDTAGNLYGTTTNGGDPTCNCGVVFKLDTAGKETVLHTFKGGTDGAYPGALVFGAHGFLYGTTTGGGDLTCDCGTVFSVNSAGTEAVLYSFTGGIDGALPNSALIRDAANNLYGTTQNDGADNRGTVFMIAP
jgi:uncharacterized repeat protein (TIGR03803 family)